MFITVTGRFITSKASKWDSFEDSNGKTVAGGSSLIAYVLDENDVIREIKANNVGPAIDKLTFGVGCKFECEGKAWRNEIKLYALQVGTLAKAG